MKHLSNVFYKIKSSQSIFRFNNIANFDITFSRELKLLEYDTFIKFVVDSKINEIDSIPF